MYELFSAWEESTIAANNGDTGPSDPKNWVVGNANQTIHAMLNIQSDTQADLATQVQELKAIGAKHHVTIVYEQAGATLRGSLRGHEHFGYKDGISQPGVAGFDPSDPNVPTGDPTATLGDVLGNPGTERVFVAHASLTFAKSIHVSTTLLRAGNTASFAVAYHSDLPLTPTEGLDIMRTQNVDSSSLLTWSQFDHLTDRET